LLKEVGPDGLQRFRDSTEPTLALFAAWQGLYLPLTANETPQDSPVPQDKLRQFLTTVKNIVGERPPPWWEATIMKVRYDNRGLISCGEIERPSYHEAGLGRLAPSDTLLEQRGDKSLVTVAGESILLPAKEIHLGPSPSGGGDFSFSAYSTPEKCFVTLHAQLPLEYHLLCFDRAKDKVIWTTTVFGEARRSVIMGSGHRHGVTIRTLGGAVLVYGGGSFSVYVEGFKMNDGSNLFRFCADN
jgi:hypothetical protein